MPATSRRNYQEEGMMEFWGNSGTEGAGRESQGRSKAVRRSMHDLWSGICGKNEEGNDLDRFADLVSLVALVRLVELGGRRDGTTGGRSDGGTELRRDGTTGGRNWLIAGTTAKNL